MRRLFTDLPRHFSLATEVRSCLDLCSISCLVNSITAVSWFAVCSSHSSIVVVLAEFLVVIMAELLVLVLALGLVVVLVVMLAELLVVVLALMLVVVLVGIIVV